MACLLIITLSFDMCCQKRNSPLNINEVPLTGRQSGNNIKGFFIFHLSQLQPLLCSILHGTIHFLSCSFKSSFVSPSILPHLVFPTKVVRVIVERGVYKTLILAYSGFFKGSNTQKNDQNVLLFSRSVFSELFWSSTNDHLQQQLESSFTMQVFSLLCLNRCLTIKAHTF